MLSTGLVDNVRMRVLSTNKKYDDAVKFDFVEWSLASSGLELRLENDARGALIGEWRFGAGQGIDNLLMITLGTGVGCAAVCDGRPLVGPDFSAGILGGHIVINPGGRACTCGGFGHLESEASGWVLPTLLRENPDYASSPLKDIENPDFRQLRQHAAAGDPCARAIWGHCLQSWGAGLVSLVHMLNPQRVIIGGGVVNDPTGILESFRSSFERLSWNGSVPAEFVCAAHPDHAGLIGAGSLFF